MNTEIYNLKKMDFGRYLIEEHNDHKTGLGLIATPEQYGKKNFELMKFVYQQNSNTIRLLNELIEMSKNRL